MPLDPLALAAILALLVIAALLLWLLYRSRRTTALRERFGDKEYDRTLGEHGARAPAEAALIEREKRVDQLELRSLGDEQRARLSSEWHRAKGRFVDDPAAALSDADRIIGAAMHARGYPVADFEERFESLTVDHASVAQNYRAGHDIAVRQLEARATTEDLRQAMIHYDALFDELVSEQDKQAEAPMAEPA